MYSFGSQIHRGHLNEIIVRFEYFYKAGWVLSALKVSIIVGSILFAINHGKALYEGTMNTERWISAFLSYLVPYCVYIIGKASNIKTN